MQNFVCTKQQSRQATRNPTALPVRYPDWRDGAVRTAKAYDGRKRPFCGYVLWRTPPAQVTAADHPHQRPQVLDDGRATAKTFPRNLAGHYTALFFTEP